MTRTFSDLLRYALWGMPAGLRRRITLLRHKSRVVNAFRDINIMASSPKALGDKIGDLVGAHPQDAVEITNERVLAYAFYSRLRRILEMSKPQLIIDAGAHEGQFGGIVRGYCEYQAPLVSFEPVNAFHAKLTENAKFYRGWETINAAVGDYDGETHINVGKGHGGTSSLLAQTENLSTFAADVQLGESQPTRVMRLDTYLETTYGQNVPESIFLKLDVQGFEELAFLSAGRYTLNLSLVLVELSAVPFYEGQRTFGAMCELLSNAGFTPILTHNNFGHAGLVFLDFDVLFCRRDALENLTKLAFQAIPNESQA